MKLNEFNKKFFDHLGFENLSDVQKQVLNETHDQRDLIVQSDTGTGKTHAFLFNLMNALKIEEASFQGLILSPTRELAMQTYDFAKEMQIIDSRIDVVLAIGGMDNKRLKSRLSNNPHIVISTPGKFKDILSWNTLRLDTVKQIVIDEMDMMLDYGFISEVSDISNYFKKETQFSLYSATIPQGVKQFAKKYLHRPIYIYIENDLNMRPRIHHYLINTRHRDIHEELLNLTNSIQPILGIIFCNTKDMAKETALFLRSYGIDCVELHGDLKDRQRRQVIREMQQLNTRYIVASDLAARGMDLPEISHVINLGLPSHDLDFYMHRSGRTGRAGRDGYSISLVHDKEISSIKKLMNLGIEFEYKRTSNGTLLDARPMVQKRQYKAKFDPEIAKIAGKKPKKIKPGYRKKRKQEIEKIKRQRKRALIQEEIRKQKKERAKKKQKEFDY